MNRCSVQEQYSCIPEEDLNQLCIDSAEVRDSSASCDCGCDDCDIGD